MKKKKVAPSGTYPFDIDDTDAGRICRIPGERGARYTVIHKETNPDTGKSWFVVVNKNGIRHPRKVAFK